MEKTYWLRITTHVCGTNPECPAIRKGKFNFVTADIGLRIASYSLNPPVVVVDIFGESNAQNSAIPFIHGAAEGVVSGELIKIIAEETDFGLEENIAALFKEFIGKAKHYLGKVEFKALPEKDYVLEMPLVLEDITKQRKTKEANYILTSTDMIKSDLLDNGAAKPFSLLELVKIYSLFDELSFPSEIRLLTAPEEDFRAIYAQVRDKHNADIAEGTIGEDLQIFAFLGKHVNSGLRNKIKENKNVTKLCLASQVTPLPLQRYDIYLRRSGDVIKNIPDLNGFDIRKAYALARYLADERETARVHKNFDEADNLRKAIEEIGFSIKDTKTGYVFHV